MCKAHCVVLNIKTRFTEKQVQARREDESASLTIPLAPILFSLPGKNRSWFSYSSAKNIDDTFPQQETPMYYFLRRTWSCCAHPTPHVPRWTLSGDQHYT